MKFYKLRFHEYYHLFFAVEADGLTERFRNSVDIQPEDCYALCSTYIRKNGLLGIQVLAVGDDWNHCQKGLRRKAMLGSFEPFEVMNLNVTMITPTLQMIKKNSAWLQENEPEVDEDISLTRKEARLDAIRHKYFPDVVSVGILSENVIREYKMKLTGINGPFAEGRAVGIHENPDQLHRNDLIRALPYQLGEDYRLLAVFTGEDLSEEDKATMQELIRAARDSGLGFCEATYTN